MQEVSHSELRCSLGNFYIMREENCFFCLTHFKCFMYLCWSKNDSVPNVLFVCLVKALNFIVYILLLLHVFCFCCLVEFHISKGKVDDLKALHRLCFNSPGKVIKSCFQCYGWFHRLLSNFLSFIFLWLFSGNHDQKKFTSLQWIFFQKGWWWV